MNPGEYNRKITLRMPLANSDNHIDASSAWAAWDVKPPKGREIQVNDLKTAEQTRWIKIRYTQSTKSITSAWVVRYGTKTNPDGTIVPVDYELASPPIDYKMKHEELFLELKVMS